MTALTASLTLGAVPSGMLAGFWLLNRLWCKRCARWQPNRGQSCTTCGAER